MKTPRFNIDGDPIEPPGLIEWASLICGLGTVFTIVYIIVVRYGMLP